MNKSFSKLLLVAAVILAAVSPMVGKFISDRVNASPKKDAPAKALGLDMPTIYGSLCYFNSSTGIQDLGMVQVPTSPDGKFNLVYQGPYAPGGGVAVDGIYYCTEYDYTNGATIKGYDLNNGQQVCEFEHGYDIVGQLALDPISNDVYGITFRPELGGYMLSKVDISTKGVNVTRIANIEKMWAAFAIAPDGQFYGITKENTSGAETSIVARLYKINRDNGALTEVGVTGQHPYDNTGAVIDPETGRMFWTVCNGLEGGCLCEVDLSTGQAVEVVHFDDNQQVSALFIPTPVAKKGAPDACTDISMTFDKGSKEGVVTLQAPKYLYDSSTEGSGPLYVIVICNGDQVGFEEVEWGKSAEIPVDMSDYEDGLYNFTIMPIGDGGEGPKSYVNNVYVGVDSPAATNATLEYKDGKMLLSWLPVTGGAHGGWIDGNDVTYTVTRADGSVAVANTPLTSFSEDVAAPSTVSQTYYTVTAKSGGLSSAPARSNSVVLGAFNPPYTSDYAKNIDLDYFTVVDGNADGKTWHVSGSNVVIDYNQYEDMDDWLISPPLRLEAGKAYTLSFSANGYMSNAPERIEVKYGTENTAEGMTNVALEPTLITATSASPKQLECVIVPKTAGIYYIGFHGISDAYMYTLTLSNFTVKESENSGVPTAPTAFTVTPDPSGALKANVSVTAPKETVLGATIASLTKLEVSRGGEVVKTFDAPAPGAVLTFEDIVTADAMYEYSAVAYNADGKGMAVSTSAFVGQDVPSAPMNVVVSRTATEGEALITWSPVTIDASGKAVHGDITYTVSYVNAAGDRKILAKNISATSYAFIAAVVDDQVFVTAEVTATSSAGTGEAGISSPTPVGTAYDYFVESFADGAPLNAWGEIKYTPDAAWQVYTEASGLVPSDGDDGFLAFYGAVRDDSAMLYSGLISLKDAENPGLTLWMCNNATAGSANNNIFKVLVRENNPDWQVAYSSTVDNAVNGREGWNKVVINLQQFEGKDVQIALVGEVVNYRFLFVDNLQIVDLPAVDLQAARISAPLVVKAGAEYEVAVKVANVGANAVKDYEVALYANSEKVATLPGTELEAGADKTFNFTLEMNPMQQSALDLYAEVECSKDAETANNATESLTINPLASALPGAKNLKAANDPAGVALNWDAVVIPEGNGAPITQDFEDADSFAAYYGNWTFVDEDGSPVGGLKDYDIPGITVGQTTGSFWVWDTNVMKDQGMEAHSGMKCLFSIYRKDDGKADDWAISPRLDGKAQTISFWARSLNNTYPEKVEVWYSTGSTNPADFVEIPTAGGKVPGQWTKFEAQLPEGAKYFAIRSVATGAFVLLVDDVTFVPADILAGAVFEGYDIYRDNKKLAHVAGNVTNFTDGSVIEGNKYIYNVVTVFSTGLGAPSNAASITTSGISLVGVDNGVRVAARDGKIIVDGAAGMNVIIVAADGKVVYSGVPASTLEVDAPMGIYVVKTAASTAKVRL